MKAEEAVAGALRRWGDAEPGASLPAMRHSWPALFDGRQSVSDDILPRIAQLDYLVQEAVLTREGCLALALEHPRVLGSYTIQVAWQERDLLAVNKPYDMRIDLPKNESPRWPEERTLAGWFSAAHPGEKVRFCHQLDHATSGVLLMATSKAAGRLGSQLFEKRAARKTYLALVVGRPSWAEGGSEVRLNYPLADTPGFARRVAGVDEPGSEAAETVVRLVRTGRWPRRGAGGAGAGDGRTCVASLVECRPVTGRRHQLRLHLAAAGVPILGDDTYGGEPWGGACCYRMYLHAQRLELPLPTGDVVIEAPCSFEDELLDPGAEEGGE